jgi:hypothetical protein
LGLAARSEFLTCRRITRIGWMIPLCRWPFPRLCGLSAAKLRWSLFSVQSSPLFELRLPLEYYPTKPCQTLPKQILAPLMGFGSLQHMKGRRFADTGTPARHVPPSGFGYPLGGLHPSIPCRFCFAPAALLGFTLRSVPLSKGIRGRYRPDGPTCRSTCRCSRRRSSRPAQQAPVPGFQPFRESLVAGRRVSPPTTGCSLGFLPF